jgi:hypothetical protein
MKKLNGAKYFILGVLFTLLVSFIIVPGAAKSGSEEAILHFRNILLEVNGEIITPTDVVGTVVEPFIIDGTTYLPVRAVAGALGFEVDWDDPTNTVILKNNAGSEVPDPETAYAWIPRTGSKYHKTETCSNMVNPNRILIQEAIEKGYEKCSNCW